MKIAHAWQLRQTCELVFLNSKNAPMLATLTTATVADGRQVAEPLAPKEGEVGFTYLYYPFESPLFSSVGSAARICIYANPEPPLVSSVPLCLRGESFFKWNAISGRDTMSAYEEA